LQATERRGYPIKVALVAGVEDLVDDPGLMRTPQRLANTVAATVERELEAPVLVVTPFGLGVAGNGIRNGVRRPVTAADARRLVRGLQVPPDPQGDELARVAMTGVRRIARAGGHRLPARVPSAEPATRSAPAGPAETVAGGRAESGGSSFAWVVPALLVPLALLVSFMRSRRTTAASKA
jgi:hypothetical protein